MTLGRLCNGCSQFTPGLLRGRCPECARRYERERSRKRRAAKGSTTQRGYGVGHQRLARAAINQHPWCAVCGSTNDLTADHVVPLSKGGTNTLSNYQVLCLRCNTHKYDKPSFSMGKPDPPNTDYGSLDRSGNDDEYLPGVG